MPPGADPGVHIVQVGLDVDVFREDAPQDSRARQLSYAGALKDRFAGSRLTCLVLSDDVSLMEQVIQNAVFRPLNCSRLRHIPRLFRALRRLHIEKRMDVLTTQDFHGLFWGALLFGKLYRVPVVAQVHDDLASDLSRQKTLRDVYGSIYAWLALKLVSWFDAVRVVNSAASAFLRGRGYRKKISVIPVAVSLVPSPREDHAQDRDDRTLRVLYIGRFVWFKNVPAFVETADRVLRRLGEAEFFLIGDGEERSAVEALVHRLSLGDKVHLLGALEPRAVARWLQKADVLLLTSRYEGFGRVVVEAMHYGVVPVCTDVNGPRDIVQDGVDGFLAPSDPDALAAKIMELATDRPLLDRLRHAARRNAALRFDPEMLRRRWLDFLLEFVAPRPGSVGT